jgi:HTH-type transcriptional regulator/antitoxin HigA
MNAPFDPDWTIAPGVTLDDWRQENGLGVKSAARTCRLSPEDFERVVAGKKRITKDVAERLYAGTQIPARLWLALERRYRDDLRRGKIDTTDA